MLGIGVVWELHACKIVEKKSVRDMLDFLKQLGVVKYTESACALNNPSFFYYQMT